MYITLFLIRRKRPFELIKADYVNGRYGLDFIIANEGIDMRVPKKVLLRNITKGFMRTRIGSMRKRACASVFG